MPRHGHILDRSHRSAPGEGLGEDVLAERLVRRDAPLPEPREVPGEHCVVGSGATRSTRRLIELSAPSPLLMRVSPRKLTLTELPRGARITLRQARDPIGAPDRLELASAAAAEARRSPVSPPMPHTLRPADTPRRGMRAARPALGVTDAS